MCTPAARELSACQESNISARELGMPGTRASREAVARKLLEARQLKESAGTSRFAAREFPGSSPASVEELDHPMKRLQANTTAWQRKMARGAAAPPPAEPLGQAAANAALASAAPPPASPANPFELTPHWKHAREPATARKARQRAVKRVRDAVLGVKDTTVGKAAALEGALADPAVATHRQHQLLTPLRQGPIVAHGRRALRRVQWKRGHMGRREVSRKSTPATRAHPALRRRGGATSPPAPSCPGIESVGRCVPRIVPSCSPSGATCRPLTVLACVGWTCSWKSFSRSKG